MFFPDLLNMTQAPPWMPDNVWCAQRGAICFSFSFSFSFSLDCLGGFCFFFSEIEIGLRDDSFLCLRHNTTTATTG
jgi:hypothetical protein